MATPATCMCGRKTKTPVDRRTFMCRFFGYTADRDTHASANMIRMDATPPVERRESTRAQTDTHREAQMDFGFIRADRRPLKHEAPGSSIST
ncbi:hypothetical protein DQ353_04630 [Arthrobacter sp. AQ5-05]|nr:hypothetical protein DQ353_04630 [Arthrobacter sp. AQ5-05]